MIYSFSTSFKKHTRPFNNVMMVTIFVIGYYFYSILYNKFIEELTLIVLIILLIISLIYVLYLHLEYLILCKFDELKIDLINNSIELKRKEGSQFFSINEIDTIVVYSSPSVHHNRAFRIMPFEDYHFAEITFKSGKKIYITNLYIVNIEAELKKIFTTVKIEWKFIFFPSILLSRTIRKYILKTWK